MRNNILSIMGIELVSKKLNELGFNVKFDEESNSHKLIASKDGKTIKVMVKASLKKNTIMLLDRDFNFLIITDLSDCYVIPKFLLRYKKGKVIKFKKDYNKLKNKFELLEITDKMELLDYLIRLLNKPLSINLIM